MTVAIPQAESAWSHQEAFSRNRGLISLDDQARLKDAVVAIAGVGGVGGGHALTLARQGVGGFRLADPDTFSVGNLNRQAGASLSSVGMNKAEHLARMVRDINPEARVEVFSEGVTEGNLDRFLDGASLYLDGLDFFAVDIRRQVFSRARQLGLWALTAAPLGFGTALICFSPRGMSFDEYCGFSPGMSQAEQLVCFLVGLSPRGLHAGYLDLRAVDLQAQTGPSSAIACQLCSAAICMEALCLITGRRMPTQAPHYAQLDLYRGRWARGRVWGGGQGILSRLKRVLVKRRLRQLGLWPKQMT